MAWVPAWLTCVGNIYFNSVGSNHSLRQERIDRLERSDLSLTHYHEPLSPDEPPPTQGSKHMAPVKQASQSSRSSDHSYKQLWKLRSTLEDDDFDDGVSTYTCVYRYTG